MRCHPSANLLTVPEQRDYAVLRIAFALVLCVLDPWASQASGLVRVWQEYSPARLLARDT